MFSTTNISFKAHNGPLIMRTNDVDFTLDFGEASYCPEGQA